MDRHVQKSRPRYDRLIGVSIAVAILVGIGGAVGVQTLGTFRTSNLIVDDNSTGLFIGSGSDPTTAPGDPAPLTQFLVRKDFPSLYYKSGSADTAWTRIGLGSDLGIASIGLARTNWNSDIGSAYLIAKNDWVDNQSITITAPRNTGNATGGDISAKVTGGGQLLVPGLQWVPTSSPNNFTSPSCPRNVTMAAGDAMTAINLSNNTCSGIFRNGTGFGLQVLAPSDRRLRTLEYFGYHYGTTVACTASLADGEGTPVTVSSSTAGTNTLNDLWTVTYSSVFTTTVILSCLVSVDESAGTGGNIQWQLLTLSPPGP